MIGEIFLNIKVQSLEDAARVLVICSKIEDYIDSADLPETIEEEYCFQVQEMFAEIANYLLGIDQLNNASIAKAHIFEMEMWDCIKQYKTYEQFYDYLTHTSFA